MTEFQIAVEAPRPNGGNRAGSGIVLGQPPGKFPLPAALLLAAIPLLVFGAVAVSRPAPPVPVKPVQSEGVRMIRMDTQTFRARWMPVNDMPPATTTNEKGNALDLRGTTSAPVVVVARPPPPAARIVKRASLRQDICARHGLRRVTYTVRGYQHWRCRR
jgi:hypothetical protein